jgi:hypothetical protein
MGRTVRLRGGPLDTPYEPRSDERQNAEPAPLSAVNFRKHLGQQFER